MELRQIKHFMAVAETGSFTKASERVSISQPALSASIAKLEDELQVKLLDRTRSKVVPTLAGQRLRERAGSILLACSAIKADLKSVEAPQALRIGVLRTLATQPVANLIAGYRRLRPGASFVLFDGTAGELRERLNDRKLDAVITRIDSPSRELQTCKLFVERFVLSAPMDHRFAMRDSIESSDLSGEAYISRSACEMSEATNALLKERRIRFRVTYRTDQDDRALSLVAAGVGVTMAPELFRAPGVKQIEISDCPVQRTMGIQWFKDAESEELSQFIAIAEQHDWMAR